MTAGRARIMQDRRSRKLWSWRKKDTSAPSALFRRSGRLRSCRRWPWRKWKKSSSSTLLSVTKRKRRNRKGYTVLRETYLDTKVTLGHLSYGGCPKGYLFSLTFVRARDGIRTRDPRLGKAILHHWATRAKSNWFKRHFYYTHSFFTCQWWKYNILHDFEQQ